MHDTSDEKIALKERTGYFHARAHCNADFEERINQSGIQKKNQQQQQQLQYQPLVSNSMRNQWSFN